MPLSKTSITSRLCICSGEKQLSLELANFIYLLLFFFELFFHSNLTLKMEIGESEMFGCDSLYVFAIPNGIPICEGDLLDSYNK